MDFDPVSVSKLNEKKLIAPGSTASSLLSEPKLRAVIENARQILKVDSSLFSFILFYYPYYPYCISVNYFGVHHCFVCVFFF